MNQFLPTYIYDITIYRLMYWKWNTTHASNMSTKTKNVLHQITDTYTTFSSTQDPMIEKKKSFRFQCIVLDVCTGSIDSIVYAYISFGLYFIYGVFVLLFFFDTLRYCDLFHSYSMLFFVFSVVLLLWETFFFTCECH